MFSPLKKQPKTRQRGVGVSDPSDQQVSDNPLHGQQPDPNVIQQQMEEAQEMERRRLEARQEMIHEPSERFQFRVENPEPRKAPFDEQLAKNANKLENLEEDVLDDMADEQGAHRKEPRKNAPNINF